jgi:hypothetical protein
MKRALTILAAVLATAALITGCEITGYQSGSHNSDSSNHDNPVTTSIYTNDMGTASTNDDVIVKE